MVVGTSGALGFSKMKYFISFLLLLSICMLFCDADGKGGKAAKNLTKTAAKGAAAMTARKASSRFFSAWTIISLVMFVIIILVVAYYLHMFYPLVCAERGKYDVMEMSHV